MEPSQDYMMEEAVHPTSVSIKSPALRRRCEDKRCLGGSKVNPAVFFILSKLLASLFQLEELNNTVH
jgi:hypothetical protein